ncbi:MAG: hypothetical protein KC656_03785, partial [Myxococcales bacterium]|nr:hypothetical protein [Myxococcales bacterium]
MRVLYGVAGEGLGHAMRSQVVLRHLVDAGHDVRVVTSGRAAEVLSARGFDVEPIRGLSLTCRRGGVARTRSLASFLAASPSMAGHNQRVFRAVMEAYDPEVCISDFDSFAHAVGLWAGRPVLSLDHQHVIDRFHHPRDLRVRHLHVARALVSAKLPGCERYVVTSFYAPRARPALAANTSLVGPILREPVRALEARRGDHVLVYQSAHGDPGLLAALAAMPDVPFRVYGVPPAH